MRCKYMTSFSLILLISSTGCGRLPVRYERAFSHTAPWNNYERVAVRTQNGNVSVTPGAGDQILIEGKVRAEVLARADAEQYLDQIEIAMKADERDPDVFVVELIVPPALRYKSVGADIEIRVPVPCGTEVRTSNGSVRAEKLSGSVNLQTSNGAVFVESVAGAVEARTSNGQIRAVYVKGNMTADTSNGRVTVDGVEGDSVLSTSNGEITARGLLGNVRAVTSNGSIRVEARPNADGQVILRASNGAIEADVPSDLRGTIELETSNGSVRLDSETISLSRIMQSRESLKADMNGGGLARVEARGANGPVTITSR